MAVSEQMRMWHAEIKANMKKSVGSIPMSQYLNGPYPDKIGQYTIPATCSAVFDYFDGEKWVNPQSTWVFGYREEDLKG